MNLYAINICGIKFVHFNIHSEFMFIQHGNLTIRMLFAVLPSVSAGYCFQTPDL